MAYVDDMDPQPIRKNQRQWIDDYEIKGTRIWNSNGLNFILKKGSFTDETGNAPVDVYVMLKPRHKMQVFVPVGKGPASWSKNVIRAFDGKILYADQGADRVAQHDDGISDKHAVTFCEKVKCDKGVTTKTCYKKKALELHPDKGGDAEEFKWLGALYDKVMKPGQPCP